MESTDKKLLVSDKKIGIFDSGIGGFSVLGELFKALPEATYFYISDDANAPYGPKSDEFITERSFAITEELLKKGVQLIVIACNTATAASIDKLREKFTSVPFVGVEPYLNAYYKMPEGLSEDQKKMMVLTTESTGKSERFKRLKERLDPKSQIDHYSLKNLARLIEEYYYNDNQSPVGAAEKFQKDFEDEMSFLKDKKYSFAILGCTHYPLVRDRLENFLHLKTISPDAHVAQRVVSLLNNENKDQAKSSEENFHFLSSKNNQWVLKKRSSLYGPFKGQTAKE
jgi:glutamate racemase